MTPELCDELLIFSFDSLRDIVKELEKFNSNWVDSTHNFSARFLECLKSLVCYHFLLMHSSYIYYMIQPFPEANHIYHRTFQADFDRMLCNALERYHSHPGFTLLLGSILRYMKFTKDQYSDFPPGLVASLYLLRQEGDGDILDDMGFSGVISNMGGRPGTLEFLTYFIELLENPERSGSHVFDQHRYATAAKECLQLCLCSHHKFSKRVTELTLHDRVLLRNKPWAWKARLGIHSRRHRAMCHVAVQQWKYLKAWTYISQYASFPRSSCEHEYYRSFVYQWRLDLLPIFLEKSAISLELADISRTRTFTTMAQMFPQRMRLAREAIAAYLLRVEESTVGSQ